MKRLLVCGGRDHTNYQYIAKTLSSYHAKYCVSLLIEGGARGADSLAASWAEKNGIPAAKVKAPWTALGKRAGPVRNQWMLDLLSPDEVLAFSGGAGTQDMVQRAKQAGIKVWEIK